jgi:hypothetical protein
MMRSSLAFSAITALVVAAASAHALESSMTVRSPLSPGELWNKIGDFCAMSEWDPPVELCHLSADGKQRTTVLFGEVVRVVAALEDWDEVNRSYAHVSELAPVKHYHASVRVIADGQTSVLKLTASYEANGLSDTEAQKIIDGTMYRSLHRRPATVLRRSTLSHTGRSGRVRGPVVHFHSAHLARLSSTPRRCGSCSSYRVATWVQWLSRAIGLKLGSENHSLGVRSFDSRQRERMAKCAIQISPRRRADRGSTSWPRIDISLYGEIAWRAQLGLRTSS